ncbi:MAG: hypothetical protein UV64_C0004G0013 [Parcubacteria group bacterium GW2011_GWC1_43_11b]|uniref:Uncharacterized protein n=1 Tax=Candidatus Vogelbacteria bacterium RIFOXYB1_FULL_42_16 TaxID=1802436 RepID=A0A1G2QDX3_9BACT|nr:MAG: hypothetical protein UV50_C0009G0020 [Parcubacteria group bacterium GW2011_GWB1_42_9]KKS89545.1 MAG: hypothetical protein UV64_C0004G0013 [Parcubacteria group bacterium GW2011_GWC1_43_11b]KKT09864.1 MAG: hypothetical protein UV88_C0004G0015 [Parcubacteria group bacterium GW2011_GWA1_43_21]OHA58161.1 MAG: hypothetical protein A2370_00450 [Candidatus Vogelbacteria bacterium RIFOXYB1_FULL_42_16]
MKSKWFEYKDKAVKLRKQGRSIRDIESELKIPRSTLSGWFKNIELKKSQKKILEQKHQKALIKARKGAVKWHNKQKADRILVAEIEAEKTLNKILINDEILELSLAMLYLGEGTKAGTKTSMGNSDPLILKLFLKSIQNLYNLKIDSISFYLHLRADQNPELMKKYWSRELKVPIKRFRKVSIDKRTIKTKTYSHYKGVCVIDCGNVAIQRKLVYISRKFCQKIIENMGL